MSAEKRAVLRRVSAFADLGDDDLDAVLHVLEARRGAPGDVLFREGEPGNSLMIVLDGELVARVRTPSGTEEKVARLGPGEVVGEMAFIDAEPRSATVAAAESGPATVLEFTRDALGQLYASAPRVAAAIQKNVLLDVARRLRDAGERLAYGVGMMTSRGGTTSPSRPGRAIRVDQLRALRALRGHADEDLELLAYISTLRTYAAGDVLVRQGEPGETCFLIADGEVVVTRDGSPSPIATLGPGALVGQLALIDRAPRSATVTASRPTIALVVGGDSFANLVRSSSRIALRFQWQVALAGVRQLRAATQRIAATQASVATGGPRMLDDWDDWHADGAGPEIALAVEPR